MGKTEQKKIMPQIQQYYKYMKIQLSNKVHKNNSENVK